MHIVLELAAAVLAIIPIAALTMAFWRTKSTRLVLALIAFIALEVRSASIVVLHTMIGVDHSFEEMFAFVGDFAVMTMFAVAFLYGTGWWGDRTPAPIA